MSSETRENSYLNLLERAKDLIEKARNIQQVIYQLAFIATGPSAYSELAKQYLEEMIQSGLATRGEVEKALDDVKRFRDKILDRRLA